MARVKGVPNNSMQLRALRAAAVVERSADQGQYIRVMHGSNGKKC